MSTPPELGGAGTLAAFGAYLVAMIAVGLWAARRGTGTDEDYFLGGRGMGALVVALSAVSSGRSAWLVIGASALAWSGGLSALWLFPGYILTELLLFTTLGPRLRQRSIELDAITVPAALDGLAREGQPPTRLPLRAIAAVVVVLFLVAYLSAQLVAGGKTLEAVFEVPGTTWGLVVTAGIVLVYTVLGGYRAVAVTDVIQALMMLAGVVLLPVLGLVRLGGFGELHERLVAIDPSLLDWNPGLAAIVSGLAVGLGSFGNPHILVRHMSLRDPAQARLAAVSGTAWNVVMAAGALLMGLVGRALFPTDARFPGGDTEELYPVLAAELAVGPLAPVLVGLLLAALFAAIMSTCDSQLLVVASSLRRDLRSVRADGPWAGRLWVVATLAAAVALSFGSSRVVGTFVLFAWGALGAAFGPPLLLLLCGRRVRPWGVAAALVVGSAVVVWWGTTPALDGLMYELVPGFLVSLAICLAAGGARPAPAPPPVASGR